MKSPFPGMDPYMQQYWRDVHTSLITYTRDQLRLVLPSGLVARANERVYFETEDELDRSFYPDVFVSTHPSRKRAKGRRAGGTSLAAEPVIVQLRDEPVTERFIEILDARSGHQVITVIEYISPTNKSPGAGYDLYRQKQIEVRQGGLNLVEIDLVLGGKRVLSVPLSRIKFRDRTRYQAIVRRGWRWSEAEVYPLPLQEPLPTISIPLRQSDSDVDFNLQAVVEMAYENGSCDTVNYQDDPDPPLEGHDAEWADELLRAAGKRK